MTSQSQDFTDKNFENYEPIKYYRDIETTHYQLDNQNTYNINHAEEVVIDWNRVLPFLPKWVLLYVMH